MNPLWLVFNLVLVIELWYCLCVYSDMGPIPTDRQHHRQGLPQAEAPSVIERQSSASRRKDASTTVMLDRTSAFAFDHENLLVDHFLNQEMPPLIFHNAASSSADHPSTSSVVGDSAVE
ncbi:hypothetical protein HBH79_082790 [Parastagonospora nodorum]|nr:hypothetical protein HBI13_050370 [Parastagonospora nodorum]KAH4088578.1 hypothetical protein HBH46_196280 [Parastagonospora nodorum]KAH4330736.1 hypothetical protein HBI00_080110 [Parastagonospora nodorum]KAH4684095.1 hypothetical protein HBH79_082790 [Parastagonospora nodorum]KAH4702704.1 hypothetical protein HBH67_128210 [Parastagonospora nodorum]